MAFRLKDRLDYLSSHLHTSDESMTDRRCKVGGVYLAFERIRMSYKDGG